MPSTASAVIGAACDCPVAESIRGSQRMGASPPVRGFTPASFPKSGGDRSMRKPQTEWLALIIGNSRLHWAKFQADSLVQTWDTDPLEREPPGYPLDASIELWLASVVPAQTPFWECLPNCHTLMLKDIPIQGMYPTLGIDRALALWGAIAQFQAPVLVIDGGTALTLTGADAKHQFVGGAILPGLRLQFQALGSQTAALPPVAPPTLDGSLPPRWATNTETAIASGIVHTLLAGLEAFIADWQQSYPQSLVTLTGGDGPFLHQALQQRSHHALPIYLEPNLIFYGIRAVRNRQQSASP